MKDEDKHLSKIKIFLSLCQKLERKRDFYFWRWILDYSNLSLSFSFPAILEMTK